MVNPSNEYKPVFVLSTGRAGSQWLARLLSQHPSALALHEVRPHLNPEAYAAWSGRHCSRIDGSIQRKRDWLITAAGHNGFAYIESSHFLGHLVENLERLYAPIFVHLHRDGRRFVESGLPRDWYRAQGGRQRILTRLRRATLWNVGNDQIDHRLRPPIRARSRLEKIAWLWAEKNSEIMTGLEHIDGTRRLSMSLDSAKPADVLRIVRCSGLPADDSFDCVIRDSFGTVVDDSKPDKVRSTLWWTGDEARAFERWAGEVMDALGYERAREGSGGGSEMRG